MLQSVRSERFGRQARRRRTAISAAAVALTSALASPASAQYTNEPFFEWTVEQSQAIGFELALQRLRILDVVRQPYTIDFPEIVESLALSDFERFGGTLVAIDFDLAQYTLNRVIGVAEAVEEGGVVDGPAGPVDANSLVPVARELLLEAYDLVVPPELRADPAFQAGIMAQLLLGEGGVAEGLEEAFIERWEYANGWSATQRVKAMWAELSDSATPEQRADVDEMLALIDEIYPSPVPPDSFAGYDPEEAETPAQRIVGVLEQVVDSALYSGRDQLRLLRHLADLTGSACEAYDAGDVRGGQVTIYAVADHYAGETTGLGSLIALFAPEVHDNAMLALRSLVTLEDLSPGTTNAPAAPAIDDGPNFPFELWLEGESPEEWMLPADRRPERLPPQEACTTLLGALNEAVGVLGG